MWLAHMRRGSPGCYLLDISWMVFVSIFLVSAPRLGRLSFFSPPPRKWPPILKPWTVTGLIQPRFKAITLHRHAEETPTRWLSSLCTVKKRLMDCLNSFFFWLHCFFVTRRKKLAGGFWGVGWLMGKGCQTKLKTDKKVNHIEMI